MNYMYPASALYVLTRPKGLGIQHDAILRQTRGGDEIVELHPDEGVRIRPVHDLGASEGFSVMRRIPDTAGADRRLIALVHQSPAYSATGFNCQHFVARIERARHLSRQVESVKGFAMVGLALLATTNLIAGLRR